MDANDKPILIYATFPTLALAETVGGRIVAERLAACVNILPGMVSIYEWEGRINRESEVVLIAKTVARCEQQLVARIKALHTYTTPAILVLPLAGGHPDFLSWITAQTRPAV